MENETQSTPDLRSLDDAVRILRSLRKELAPGSLIVWRMIDHACKHIEREIGAELLEESAIPVLGKPEVSRSSVYIQ